MTDDSSIIDIKGLTKHYGRLKAVDDVSFSVEHGMIFGILGPNGAGKTTLFNTITGKYRPKSGSILLKGKDVTGFKPDKLVRMGLGRSFQINSTFAGLTTFQNLRMAVLARKNIRFNFFRNLDKMQPVTDETDAFLARIGLSAERNLPASLLSYGKHRCLELSLAMATDPDLVMLDEPAAGMSREETHQMVKLIRELTHDKTVVIIEHDMDVVFSLADRITVLHHGEILATGAPEEIKANQDVKDAYLGETKVGDAA
ncbi:MAG: ABC transporter ATP-binding protein [Desulfobacterium sp.]|nr:ABC transporter ATP-binding protein [Desulfobacterium sp.]